ncbi:ribonuclease E/G [Sphingomonas oleivorans]|uniref:Ribonuclease E n=2 Tax=Sphingomonas oleivorans TaxID=1735121 RepID=A0A2T5G0D3_9SPHN|nr:ribonuclease E/G [Sphingomonas oleivorans]
MLIDARHPEETRVAVVKGNRIEEFDFESAERKQLKGNIYLAKVTRVEPSLQAAFVDYGGNRHGFLAFSEIHPDYYQIPKEDREALLREEAEHAAEEEALRASEADEEDEEEDLDDEDVVEEDLDREAGEEGEEDRPRRRPVAANHGEDNAVEGLRQKRMALRRRYKIQDVIRRRQVLLVQVVKEERGNKGAALTTYLSLAGRYCVLMPNTSHGGGISRKISNASDRKRLKSIMAELNLPKTMGCIVRTAGLQRTKTEIKRDFDYLARLWDEIREKTLSLSAPAEIYADSDLVKRAIRDIYNRDIDEVIVEGEEGYRAARSFMRLLMPSHGRKIAHYADAVPLFQRFGVEDQLAAMYQPLVQLKSGGYLVINPTEALVSIDINSGRSTREHNIEQTATATNLEAAAEIARQLRLRDMAGLIVIDFIDMENSSNIRKVEKAMKEALKNDRARIQVGRISSFGLFEMSRQRIRTGVLEASTRSCPHCEGTGLVRTASSAGLSALRMLEEEAARGRGSRLQLRASQEAALYILNRKRAELAEIEDRYGVMIEVVSDGSLEGARMTVESGGPPPAHPPRLPQPIQLEFEEDEEFFEEEEEEEEELIEAEAADLPEERAPRGGREEEQEEGRNRRRRRRRRRGGRREEEQGEAAVEAAEAPEPGELEEEAPAEDLVAEEAVEAEPVADAEEEGEVRRRRGRRGRRGGRRRNGEGAAVAGEEEVPVEALVPEAEPVLVEPEPAALTEVEEVVAAPVEPVAELVEEVAKAPRARRRPRARKAETVKEAAVEAEAPVVAEPVAAEPVAAPEAAAEEAPAKPKRTRKPRAKAAAPAAEAPEAVAEQAPAKPKRTRKPKAAPAPEPAPVEAPVEAAAEVAAEAETGVASVPAEPEPEATGEAAPRRGWWQRTFGA